MQLSLKQNKTNKPHKATNLNYFSPVQLQVVLRMVVTSWWQQSETSTAVQQQGASMQHCEVMLGETRQKMTFISVNHLQLDDTKVPRSAFSLTAQCPWRTSLVKPPNPATTSSIQLVVSMSIFPPRLQWSLSSNSFYYPVTTVILSFLACQLPQSIAFVTFRTVLAPWGKKT